MRHSVPSAGVAMFALLASFGCSGGGSGGGTPTGPSPGPGPSAVMVTILGERGNQSFSPNPATASSGQMVAWRNNDSVIHRVRFNDGSLDTQDILPGQTSTPRAMPTDGANYHCPLHPGMIGSFNAPGAPPPECDDPLYC